MGIPSHSASQAARDPRWGQEARSLRVRFWILHYFKEDRRRVRRFALHPCCLTGFPRRHGFRFARGQSLSKHPILAVPQRCNQFLHPNLILNLDQYFVSRKVDMPGYVLHLRKPQLGKRQIRAMRTSLSPRKRRRKEADRRRRICHCLSRANAWAWIYLQRLTALRMPLQEVLGSQMGAGMHWTGV